MRTPHAKFYLIHLLYGDEFAHSFDFHCLTNFTKGIHCARFLFGVRYYVNVQFTPRRAIDGSHYGDGMSTNNIHLLQFKIQGHLQK